MKLQVTASLSPRAAAARRALRSIICAGVAVGRATPGARGNGVEGTLSRPWMRSNFLDQSAGPSTSRRHDGTATCHVSSRLTLKPSRCNISCCRSSGTATPASAAQRPADRQRLVGTGGAPAHDLRGLAAGQFDRQRGAELKPVLDKSGVGAPLEAGAGVGGQAELLPVKAIRLGSK